MTEELAPAGSFDMVAAILLCAQDSSPRFWYMTTGASMVLVVVRYLNDYSRSMKTIRRSLPI